MKKLLEFIGLMLLLAGAVLIAHEVQGQTPVPPSKDFDLAANPSEIPDFVKQQFGEKFKLDRSMAPIFGDFDGDGRQDVIFVATGDNPLMSEGLFHYKTADPYNASFGFGNPKVTMSFNANDESPRFLLVVHNIQSPVRKFVLVNVPFKHLRLGHMMLKKKPIDALEAVDESGVQGAVYFDGKKYRWEIIGTELEQQRH